MLSRSRHPTTSLPHPDPVTNAIQPEFAGTWDVIVVGSGAAGLYTTLHFPDDWRVLLLTKETLPKSSSSWAQGGIAAAIAEGDTPDLHAADTLKAGAGLCEPAAVRVLVEEARDRIEDLLKRGVEFDRRTQAGSSPLSALAVTLEAAHSRHRVLHVADATGKALVQNLLAQVKASPQIEIWERAQVSDLWMQDGDCQGVAGWRWESDRDRPTPFAARSRATVLATGGGGQLFSRTTNPPPSTADGHAIAWRAGAALRDLEFVQFHPTALTIPGAPRFLISEAVRGEGAHLIDAQGDRFAFHTHPDGELAPRDVVSRAIYLRLAQKTPDEPDWVWLDLRHLERDRVLHRFPTIAKFCQKYGIDILTEPIPVSPAAHYWMGGLETDLQGRTTLPGLYAVGELASTGVHGANRLASNSLLECLVFATRLARDIVASRDRPARETGNDLPTIALPPHYPPNIRTALATLMWDAAGICRHERQVNDAIAILETWHSDAQTSSEPAKLADLHAALELQNLLDVAPLMLRSIVFRTESRGGHYRQDYPAPSDRWKLHTRVVREAIAISSLTSADLKPSSTPSDARPSSLTAQSGC
ncbi:MAG: L-aspartate oxidase [Cyanobacteria bacterium J06639_1]